jgi:nitrate reductase gamma subunit
MSDIVLFAAFPYVAVVLAVAGGVYRYRKNRFSYSSLSSQLLENKRLFWGSVPWHYGIVVVLLAHLIGFLVPGMWASLTSTPTALYSIELVGFAFGMAALFGLCVLMVRRASFERIRAVTSTMDWVLLLALLLQVALGMWVSLVYRWGADWYVDTAVPWLISLVSLNPQTHFVSSLPWLVKLHMLNGFVVIALFPFSRLVHVIMFPFWYLWRPYQLVISNRPISRHT